MAAVLERLPGLVVQWPEKLIRIMEGYGGPGDPLKGDRTKRKRYYVSYGGRGSTKSWTWARALLIQGLYDPLRVLCAREIMRTIADSVHRLLADQVEALGLGYWYRVSETGIHGKNGTEFIFAGLRALDAEKIKSFEGIDIAWVEEAQAVTKRSWGILVPTIRAERSEIWATFNPELDSDDTYQRFVVSPPPNSWVQRVTWRDNPWFPKVLDDERRHLEKSDPDEARHVWEGEPRTVVAGAIYAREVTQMVEERRVRNVPYDPTLPVHTVWDLGWADACAIIMLQKIHSELRVIRYTEGSGLTVAEWVVELQKLRYAWGWDYLPHDGANTARQTGVDDQTVLKRLGRRVKIIPRGDVEAGIRTARLMFPRTYIDQDNAAGLVECLKKYRRTVPVSTGEPGAPVHDEYSHGADAWRGLGQVVESVKNELVSAKPNIPVRRIGNPRIAY